MRRPVAKPRAAPRRRKLIYLVLVLAVVVCLAPTIIATIGLHNQFLRGVLPSEAGVLTAESASFGWFSPTRLVGVRVHTPDGGVLLEVPTLTLDRSILNLVGDRSVLGEIRIEEPVLRVVAGEASSNLEAFVACLLDAQDEEQAPLSCAVSVDGGTIEVVDETTGRTAKYAIEDLACELEQGDLTSLRAALTDSSAGSQPGRLSVRLAPHGDSVWQVDVAARNWPVGAASPGARRLLDDARVAGRLVLDATATWSADGGVESSGSATVTEFSLEAPPLGTDRMQLAELRVPWKVRLDGQQLLVDELSITSELGHVVVHGSLPARLASEGLAKLTAAEVLSVPLTASGSLDLARLAAMLPRTLRIKNGVVVSSGHADFQLESRPAEAAQHWSGSLEIRDLVAKDRERTLQWERPVVVAASVHVPRNIDGSWTIESLICQSDFLQLTAQGDVRHMDATANFDLARLAADLGRFVDIAHWNLGGRGTLRAQWRPADDGTVRANVSGAVNGLRFVDSSGRLWQEPSVQLQAEVLATLPDSGSRIMLQNGSQVTLGTASDSAKLTLASPMKLPLAAGQDLSRGELRIEGDIAGWLHCLSPWIDLQPWRLEGGATLAAQVKLSEQAVSAESVELVLTNLQAIGPGWRIHEPQVTLQTSGRYVPAEQSIELGETTVVGSSASLRARNTHIGLSGPGFPQIRSEASFVVALQRVDSWRTSMDGRPLRLRPAGMAKGTVRLQDQPQGLHAEVSAAIADFVMHEYVAAAGGRPPGYRPAWQEEQIELAFDATYASAKDRWDIQQAVVRSDSLAAAVIGSLADATGRCDANLRGTFEYDLADVGPIIAAQLGLDLAMTGREKATFELVGPLRPGDGTAARVVSTGGGGVAEHWSQRLRGQMSAGWESIRLFGLPIGRGQIDAQLYDGGITFAPLDVRVGQAGRLTVSAVARLLPSPAELVIREGPVIANVEITPEVSGRMLKYFIPSLADAVQTQGTFSLATVGGRVPLASPLSAEAAGTLTVHAAQVRPGRASRAWILLAEQIEALLKGRQVPQTLTRPERDLMTFQEQAVPYRIAGGRVYHENLVFNVGEVVVRSHGSVGFDQTLAIQIEVPVKDVWIDGQPQLARFKGQSLRGTIRGTFDQLDFGTFIGDVAQQIGQGLIEGAIEQELNRALDQLFQPR